MATLGFNAAQVAPATTFTPLPAGTYTVQIEETDVKDTKNNTGKYLEAKFSVLEGEFINRKVYGRITIQNQNQKATEIGQAQLSAICHAVGVLNLQDTTQLHGRPLRIRVSVRKDDTHGDSNDIKGYEAVQGGFAASAVGAGIPQQQPVPGAVVQQQAAQQPAAAAAPPWQR
ncbi:DUF669 domain-containing protein [Alcaligenaceae bacterium]|nr:DUF669 domain-containing protein [Alcaligenaceae bacterium]